MPSIGSITSSIASYFTNPKSENTTLIASKDATENNINNKKSLLKLPNEVLTIVMEYFDLQDLSRFASTSRKSNALCDDSKLRRFQNNKFEHLFLCTKEGQEYMKEHALLQEFIKIAFQKQMSADHFNRSVSFLLSVKPRSIISRTSSVVQDLRQMWLEPDLAASANAREMLLLLSPYGVPNKLPPLPVHWAIYHGKWEFLKALFQIELANNVLSDSKEGALFNMAGLLINQEPSIFLQKDSKGCTILHHAAKRGRLAMTKFLMEKVPCLIKETDAFGKNILHYAAESRDLAIAKFLVKKVPRLINKTDGFGENILHYAAKSGCLAMVQFFAGKFRHLTDQQSSWGNSVLFYAAGSGCLAMVKFIMGEQVPNLSKEDYKWSALRSAASNGHLDIVEFFLGENLSLINERDADGKTVLHHAASSGHLSIVKLLLDKNMSLIGQQDIEGKTALHHAAENGHLEIAERLVCENLSAIDQQCNLERTALDYAITIADYRMVEFLLNKGATLYSEWNNSKKWDLLPLAIASKNKNNFNIVQWLSTDLMIKSEWSAPSNLEQRFWEQKLVDLYTPDLSVYGIHPYQYILLGIAIANNRNDIVKCLINGIPNLKWRPLDLSNFRRLLKLALKKGNSHIIKLLAKSGDFDPFFCKEDFAILAREKKSENGHSKVNALMEGTSFPFGLTWLGKPFLQFKLWYSV